MQSTQAVSGVFRFRRLVSWLILVVGLSACIDLSAIRTFSNISVQAETYTRVTEDYVNVPERMKYYRGRDIQQTYEEIRKHRESTMPGMLGLHKAVAEYMRALGELAGNEPISYKKSLDSLKTEVGNSPLVKNGFVDKPTVEALSGLADLLSKAVTYGYRQKKLQEVIGEANPYLNTIISNQQRIIEDYETSLGNEKQWANEYYGTAIKNLLDLEQISPGKMKIISDSDTPILEKDIFLIELIQNAHTPEKTAALVLLRDGMHARLTEIENKKQIAAKYLVVLENIRQGHQQLFNMRYHINSQASTAAFKTYNTEIEKSYQALMALK